MKTAALRPATGTRHCTLDLLEPLVLFALHLDAVAAPVENEAFRVVVELGDPPQNCVDVIGLDALDERHAGFGSHLGEEVEGHVLAGLAVARRDEHEVLVVVAHHHASVGMDDLDHRRDVTPLPEEQVLVLVVLLLPHQLRDGRLR